MVSYKALNTAQKLVQLENVDFKRLDNEFGRVIDCKLEQFEKADSPILVTVFGIITDVSSLLDEKALSSILITVYFSLSTTIVSGIIISPVYFLPLTTFA